MVTGMEWHWRGDSAPVCISTFQIHFLLLCVLVLFLNYSQALVPVFRPSALNFFLTSKYVLLICRECYFVDVLVVRLTFVLRKSMVKKNHSCECNQIQIHNNKMIHTHSTVATTCIYIKRFLYAHFAASNSRVVCMPSSSAIFARPFNVNTNGHKNPYRWVFTFSHMRCWQCDLYLFHHKLHHSYTMYDWLHDNVSNAIFFLLHFVQADWCYGFHCFLAKCIKQIVEDGKFDGKYALAQRNFIWCIQHSAVHGTRDSNSVKAHLKIA